MARALNRKRVSKQASCRNEIARAIKRLVLARVVLTSARERSTRRATDTPSYKLQDDANNRWQIVNSGSMLCVRQQLAR